jgi:hypothetical protein
MKKTIIASLITVAFAANAAVASTLSLSNFGSSVSSDGGWTYTPETSTISGVQAPAALLFPDPEPTAFSLLTVGSVEDLQLTLTATVNTSPSGGFTVSLEDNVGIQISTNFAWSAFTIGSSTVVSVPLGANPGGFNYTNVVNWNLNSGNNGNALNVTLSNLSVTAVPEPSTYALMALGGLVVFYMIRRRKIQA